VPSNTPDTPRHPFLPVLSADEVTSFTQEISEITCTRRLQFCAGHRVVGHEGKCAHIHGHNYVVYLTAKMETLVSDQNLDSIGRVVDFSVLKERIGGWIAEKWDHGFILWAADVPMAQALDKFESTGEAIGNAPRPKRFYLPANPTAENMARYLLQVVGPYVLADLPICLVKVTVWETENCYAEASIND